MDKLRCDFGLVPAPSSADPASFYAGKAIFTLRRAAQNKGPRYHSLWIYYIEAKRKIKGRIVNFRSKIMEEGSG